MAQAEIAGGSLTPAAELPRKGYRLRDFVLQSAEGTPVRLFDFRGRKNLVLIVGDDAPETSKIIRDVASRYSEIKNYEAEVLLILHGDAAKAAAARRELNLQFVVLADPDGQIHRELGAIDAQGKDAASVYVTDRFGEVFAAYRNKENQPLPDAAEILKWLEFVEGQCPECEAPEWPV
jgi:peroxiredoxin